MPGEAAAPERHAEDGFGDRLSLVGVEGAVGPQEPVHDALGSGASENVGEGLAERGGQAGEGSERDGQEPQLWPVRRSWQVRQHS